MKNNISRLINYHDNIFQRSTNNSGICYVQEQKFKNYYLGHNTRRVLFFWPLFRASTYDHPGRSQARKISEI